MFNSEKYSNLLQNKLLKIKLKKLDDDFFAFKSAYPNYSEGMTIPGEHNLDRWVQALKDIYYKNNQGMPWKQAFDSSTDSWNPMEKTDFNNWVNFYQQQGHLKYKKAQMSWYTPPEEDSEEDTQLGQVKPYSGYFAPNGQDYNKNLHSDIGAVKDASENDISPAERKKILDKHKKKLISRLDSVEKLLRSDEGHLLTESEYDSLLESIFSLKKKITSLNKKTSGVLFYQDLIVREANILANKGFYKAASFLYVSAQAAAAPPPAAEPSPISSPASGSLDAPKNDVQVPPTASNAPSPISGGGTAGNLPGDTTENNSPLQEIAESLGEGFDVNTSDDLVIYDDDTDDGDDLDEYLIAEAQAAPPPLPAPSPAPNLNPPENITVLESEDRFDDKLDDVLSNVKIEDVVKKIEDLSKIFKTREIPRQLAIVDMMLDKLGIASFFPALSEATNKALESNNYILTRIEAMLTQLSGAIKTDKIDLKHEKSVAPQAENIKTNLQQKSELDRERKEMRKELADKALEERMKEETPDLEVTEDELAPPAAPPIMPPAAPIAPPAIPAPVGPAV
jgi:hypothetical protein